VFLVCIDPKMEAANSSRVLVTVYQSTRRYVSGDFLNTARRASSLASSSFITTISNKLNGVACVYYKNHINHVNIRLSNMNHSYSRPNGHSCVAVTRCTDCIIHLLSVRN